MLFEEETKEALIQALNFFYIGGNDYPNFQLKDDKIYVRFASNYKKEDCQSYLQKIVNETKETLLDVKDAFSTKSFPFCLRPGKFNFRHTKGCVFKVPLTLEVIDNLSGMFIENLLLLKIDIEKIPPSLFLSKADKKQYVYAFSFLQEYGNLDLEKEKITKELFYKYGFELETRGVDVPDIGLKHYVFILKSGIEQAIQKAVIDFPKLLTKTSLLTLFNIFISDLKVKYKKKYSKEIEITNSIVNKKGEISSVSFKCSSDSSPLTGGEIALQIKGLYDKLSVWACDNDEMQAMIDFDYQTISAIMKHVHCDPNYITKALEQAKSAVESTQGQHPDEKDPAVPSTSNQSSNFLKMPHSGDSGISSSGDSLSPFTSAPSPLIDDVMSTNGAKKKNNICVLS